MRCFAALQWRNAVLLCWDIYTVYIYIFFPLKNIILHKCLWKLIGFMILFYPKEYVLFYQWFYVILLNKTISMVGFCCPPVAHCGTAGVDIYIYIYVFFFLKNIILHKCLWKLIGFMILFYPNDSILFYQWFYLIHLSKTISIAVFCCPPVAQCGTAGVDKLIFSPFKILSFINVS